MCSYFRFDTGAVVNLDANADQNNYIFIAVFTRKEGTGISASKKRDKKTFYKEVYASEGRMIFGMPESAYYPNLTVSRIPFGKAAVQQGPYLISPISQSIRDYISQQTGADQGTKHRKTYPKDEFVQFVTGTDEFYALVEWVYKNQTGALRKDELVEEYKKFLEDIYNSQLRSSDHTKGNRAGV